MTNNKSIISAGLFFLLGGIAVWSYNISTNTATSVATDVSTSVATEIVTDAMNDVVDDIILVATDISTSVAKDVVADAMNDGVDDNVDRVTPSITKDISSQIESIPHIEEITNTQSQIVNSNPSTSCENIKFEIGSSTKPRGITYEQRCEMLNRFIDNIRSSGSVCDRVSYFDVNIDASGIEKSWTLKCNDSNYRHEYSDGVLKSLDPDDIRQEGNKEALVVLLPFILMFGLAIITPFIRWYDLDL